MAIIKVETFKLMTWSAIFQQLRFISNKSDENKPLHRKHQGLCFKPGIREEVYKAMMSKKSSKESIIMLFNPSNKQFIESFVKPESKEVICFYDQPKFETQMKEQFEEIPDKITLMFRHLSDMKTPFFIDKCRYFKDINVKILLKEYHQREFSLWKRHIYDYTYHELCFAGAASIEWYCVMPSCFFKKLQVRALSGQFFLPPFHIFTPVMKLNYQDLEPSFKTLRIKTDELNNNKIYTTLEKDLVLVKSEHDLETLTFLPTLDDRLKFVKFSKRMQAIVLDKRVALTLHEFFPGCLKALSDAGFYINALKRDLTAKDFLHIYLTLSKVPGFEESELYYKMMAHEEEFNLLEHRTKQVNTT